MTTCHHVLLLVIKLPLVQEQPTAYNGFIITGVLLANNVLWQVVALSKPTDVAVCGQYQPTYPVLLLKFGQVAVVEQDILAVTAVHSQLGVLVVTMHPKLSLCVQDGSILFVPAEVGHVMPHTHVWQVWAVHRGYRDVT
jgi:hypothetical protein